MNTLSLHIPIIGNMAIETKTGSKVAFFALLGLTLTLLGIYIFQFGNLAKNGDVISQYKNEIKILEEKNLALKTATLETIASPSIEEIAFTLNFVEAGDEKYIPLSFARLSKNFSLGINSIPSN